MAQGLELEIFSIAIKPYNSREKEFLNLLSILLLPMESLSFRFLVRWLSLKEISSVKERK